MSARERYQFGWVHPVAKGKRESAMEPEEVREYIDALRKQRSRYTDIGSRLRIDRAIERHERALANQFIRSQRPAYQRKRLVAGGMLFAVVTMLFIMAWTLTSEPHSDAPPAETSNPFK